jgi:hypothetical protein
MRPNDPKSEEDAMKSSNKWARNTRAIARTVTVLVLAVIIVGMSITPVLARDDRGYHGRGRHGHPYHGPRGYYAPGYYPAPGYGPPPPPVVYAPPPPPPGINLVFPIHIR